jgi:surface polysaccharide O-acyltransferase-like enzyme
MLLGIVLHSALAYTGGPWVVSDSAGGPVMAGIVEFIHGFRMPLFFIVSGYFTQMLLTRRGLGAMVRHRLGRIGLPLLLGMVTIVPLVWAASGFAAGMERQLRAASPSDDFNAWRSAARGDLGDLMAALDQGAGIDAPDPAIGLTPLGWAAAASQTEAARLLLDRGANPNAPARDGSAPLHTAAFLGRPEMASLLLTRGADPSLQTPAGLTAQDVLELDEEITMPIVEALRLPGTFADILEGRRRVAETLASPPARWAPERNWITTLTQAPVFHHLWFLWHLLFLVCGLAVWSLAEARLPALPTSLSPLWAGLAILLGWAAFLGMSRYGFGPETSIGLLPMLPVIGLYALFFAYGAWLRRGAGRLARLRSWRWLGLALGVAAFGAWKLAPAAAEIHFASTALQLAFAVGISLSALSWAEAWPWGENRQVRWISDSSYWLYLAHLPLVMAMQGALLTAPGPGWLKALVISVGTAGVLWLVYALVIRHTWVGRMLHGRRARAGAAG